jgi:hypothetical protein
VKAFGDDELDRALRGWKAPAPPAGMESVIFAAYRSEFRRSWRAGFFWSWRIQLPLPVAGAVVLLVVFLSVALLRAQRDRGPMPAPQIIVRTVEVPVVRERIVVRTVHQGATRAFGGFRPVANLPVRILRGEPNEN